MAKSAGTAFARLHSFFSILVPPPMPKLPTQEELDTYRRQGEDEILFRQGEGNVLLASGRVDMSNVDLNEDEA